MIGILPIILASQKDLWLSKQGLCSIEATLTTLSRTRAISEVYIGTDEKEILSLAQSFSEKAFFLTPASCETTILYPPGTSELLRAMDSPGMDYTGPVAVIDFRFPMIEGRHLEQAVSEFTRTGADALISVHRMTDHPCQLKTPYQILETGFIPLKAPNQASTVAKQLAGLNIEPEDYEVSAPFPFFWPSHLSGGQIAVYVENGENGEFHFLPAESQTDKSMDKLWVYEPPSTARILWKKSDVCPWSQDMGEQEQNEFFGTMDEEQFHAVVTRDKGSGQYHLHMNPDHFSEGTCVLKIALLKSNGIVVENEYELERSGLDRPFSFFPGEKEIIGIIYSLYGIVETGPVDTWDLYVPHPDLWIRAEGSERMINTRTGRPINGRQDFPEVFEPDGAICITHRANLMNDSLDVFPCHNEMGALMLSPSEALRIESELDFLQYRIIQTSVREDLSRQSQTVS